jgi:hypothetical protein
MQLQESPFEFRSLLQSTKQLSSRFIGLAETKVNWDQPCHLHVVSSAIRQQFKSFIIQHSVHPQVFLTPNKPGGTLSILLDRWVSRFVEKGQDPYGLGQWSYLTVRSKSKTIVMITEYRVCNSSISSTGDTTASAQQFCSLQQASNKEGSLTTPHPHCQMLLDLKAWISKLQSEQCSIILCIDNNEDIASY